MDINLHTQWILKDRKERSFVNCINQEQLQKITELVNEDISYEKMLELDSLLYSLTKEDFSKSKQTLDFFINIPDNILEEILQKYKHYRFGNTYETSERNIKKFHDVNIPLIRMMDYFFRERSI